MPNKTYWNQVQEIMEFTDAMGRLLGEDAYSERDRKEMQESLRDVEAKQAILDEVLEYTTDFFTFLAEEAAEVFGDAKKRLREAAADMQDDEWPELERNVCEHSESADGIEEEVKDET